MIRHDHGAAFVLVVCHSCPDWTQPAESKMHAHLIGALHEQQVHPRRATARNSAQWYARQHADEFRRFLRYSEFAAMIALWESSVTGASRPPQQQRPTSPRSAERRQA